jgi:ferredoxin-NADP reductase
MAIVKKYKAEVISVSNPLENIYTVEFKSLTGNFKYSPGQFLHLALDEYDPSSGWPESRCFSMQSAPKDRTLKITFAIKGCFTQKMSQELIPGKIVDIKLPYGELFQQEHAKDKTVFIAGGTGVTPFLSAFTDDSFSGYENPKLYLGVREKRYNLYFNELVEASQINSSLKTIVKSQNEVGMLDIDEIFNENGIDSCYFISGPQLMISSFRQKLLKNGVQENNIKTDEWE